MKAQSSTSTQAAALARSTAQPADVVTDGNQIHFISTVTPDLQRTLLLRLRLLLLLLHIPERRRQPLAVAQRSALPALTQHLAQIRRRCR